VAGTQLGCRRARLSARSWATQRRPEARSPTQTCQPSWPGCSRSVRTCAAASRSRRPRSTSGWRNTCKRPLNVSRTSRNSCVLRRIVSRLASALTRTDCESLCSQRSSARSVQELEQRALQAEVLMQDALAAGRQAELERQQLLNELATSQVESAAPRGHARLATQTDVFSAASQATAEQLSAERERLATELGAAFVRADDAAASASQGQAEQWRQQLDDAQHKLQLALQQRDKLQQVWTPRACRLHSLAPPRLSSALLPSSQQEVDDLSEAWQADQAAWQQERAQAGQALSQASSASDSAAVDGEASFEHKRETSPPQGPTDVTSAILVELVQWSTLRAPASETKPSATHASQLVSSLLSCEADIWQQLQETAAARDGALRERDAAAGECMAAASAVVTAEATSEAATAAAAAATSEAAAAAAAAEVAHAGAAAEAARATAVGVRVAELEATLSAAQELAQSTAEAQLQAVLAEGQRAANAVEQLRQAEGEVRELKQEVLELKSTAAAGQERVDIAAAAAQDATRKAAEEEAAGLRAALACMRSALEEEEASTCAVVAEARRAAEEQLELRTQVCAQPRPSVRLQADENSPCTRRCRSESTLPVKTCRQPRAKQQARCSRPSSARHPCSSKCCSCRCSLKRGAFLSRPSKRR